MTVYLVGAGPGDPGLMTVRSLELIASADVIVYDRLIPVTALDGARQEAELVYAGKEGGGPSVSQSDIHRLLLEYGAAGRSVVRLKGGDPFVFGRGGEEAEALRAAEIEFEVVPGMPPARSPSSPATRIRASPSRRSTGRRWRRFRARSSSTWGSVSSAR
jgi:uroporphyrinogen III methyltransferase/synthase